MLDKKLIKKINEGRCFVFVGSGPSCELGYPSWRQLAEKTFETLLKRGCTSDLRSYQHYIDEGKYPELFRQAERDLQNDRSALVELLKPLLRLQKPHQDLLYETISTWPFACYLTTNFDDEIQKYLNKLNQHFTTVRNRKEDFYVWREGVSHVIQKLHSDLNHPNELILTSADYQRVYTEDEGQFFRDKLSDVFAMFDVLIVGHSLSDPDIDYILQLAKHKRDPRRPLYMIAADYTIADELEFLEKYNIILVQYSNSDGTHSELKRMLKVADRFIASRSKVGGNKRTGSRSEEEVESAIAITMFRRLQGIRSTDYLSPIILADLNSNGEEGKVLNDILNLPKLKHLLRRGSNEEAVIKGLDSLVEQNLVTVNDGIYRISTLGHTKVQELHANRKTEKDQAFGQFRLDLQESSGVSVDTSLNQCQRLAEEVIVESFERRGLVVANQIFSEHSPRPDELSDIFGYTSDKANEIENASIKAAFIEAMYQFIVEPSPPQRSYLASVSQGYFMYHLLGLNPSFYQVQIEIFQKTVWLCDSSVLLPLIAKGCHSNTYAIELFNELSEKNANLCTTPKLLQEAWGHLRWAINFIENNGIDSPEFYHAALVKGSYSQNLFIDGFIRLSSEGKVGTFNDYLNLVIPGGSVSRDSFEREITKDGLDVISVSELDGFEVGDWGGIEDAKSRIEIIRKERGTYRSSLQIESEAEVWILIQNLKSGRFNLEGINSPERFYFLSLGRIIDVVSQSSEALTWTPESLYRYLSAISGRPINPELLQQCMLHGYFYAGISFIDRTRYEQFFGPSIDAAKASFEEERVGYIREIEHSYTGDLEDVFNETPDLEKPFFVAQMGWRLAEVSKHREESALQRALRAESMVKELESERDQVWKTRSEERQKQEEARLRNLKNPKHVRKRQRQAKKRRRNRK